MKITRSEEQGLRLAMRLAHCGGQANLAQLARLEGLSEALVAKILGTLRRGGIVVAYRGRNGRYELVAPPERISTLQILRAFGRPLLRGCVPRDEPRGATPCAHDGDCSLRSVWNHLEVQISRVLGEITLADLIRDQNEVRAQMAGLWAPGPGETPGPEEQDHTTR